jgi:8-oxo-dGTP pyrophosphatase MutT (NUDIX family)
VGRDEFEIGDGKPDVAAAGGVLIAPSNDGPLIAVIHRPKYMDWSLPKGKLEEGEGWQEAALREVEEETGYRARALDELDRVSYLDRKSRRKLVRYWLMEPLDGQFEPHGEVDELRWVSVDEADRLLTYEHDKEIVHEALRRHGDG